MQEFFLETLTIFFKKLCFDSYLIGYYSSQAIKLDTKASAHRVDLTSSSLRKLTLLGLNIEQKG